MSERGFVITVDAFLSVTMIVLFIILSFFYLSKVNLSSWNSVDLKTMTSDELTVLEKSLVFEDALKRGSSELILSSLNSTPIGYCFEATLFSQSFSPIIHTIKAGCTKNATNIASNERVIIVPTDSTPLIYVARVEGWVK
jgi:hypothetical protein